MASQQPQVNFEEAVNALIDGISTVFIVYEEAESDLRKRLNINSSQTIDQALTCLIGEAEKNIKKYEEKLAKEMKECIADIKIANEIIKGFSGKTMDAQSGKPLIDSIKKLVITCSRMLQIDDDFKIRVTIQAGKQAVDTLKRMSTINNVALLASVAPDFGDHVTFFIKLLKMRLILLSKPQLVTAFNECIEILTHGIGTLLQHSKEAITNPNDATKLDQREATHNLLAQTLAKSLNAVAQSSSFLALFDITFFFSGGGFHQLIDPLLAAKIRELQIQIKNHLLQLNGNAFDGKIHLVSTGAREVAGEVESLAGMAAKMQDGMGSETPQGVQIQEAQHLLKDGIKKYINAQKKFLKEITNPKAKQAVLGTADLVELTGAQIAVAATSAEFQDLIQHMQDLANSKDMEQAKLTHGKLKQKTPELITVMGALSYKSKNKLQKDVLAESEAGLEASVVRVGKALNDYSTDSMSQPKRVRFVKEVEDLQKCNSDLFKAAMMKPTHIYGDNLEHFSHAPDRIKSMVQHALDSDDTLDELDLSVLMGEDQGASAQARFLAEHMKALLTAAAKFGETTDDEKMKAILAHHSEEAKEGLKSFVAATRAVVANPQQAQIQVEFEKAMMAVRKQLGNFVATAKQATGHNTGGNSERKSLTLKASSFDMALENLNLNANDQLLESSLLVKKKLEKLLAAAAQTGGGHSKEMLNGSKEIADNVNTLTRKIVESSLADIPAKHQLETVAHVPQNLANQLKVLTAVNLASQGSASANNALLGCSNQLADTLATMIATASKAKANKK